MERKDMEKKLFNAIRNKYRYTSQKGSLSAEDLCGISLEDLDQIMVGLYNKIQSQEKKSFIGKRNRTEANLEDRFEVALYILEIRKQEEEEKKNRMERKSQIDFLKNLKEKKEMEKLEGMSIEDIEKKMKELES